MPASEVPAHGNLADPEYEPTDEELAGLMKRAFANVTSAREASVRRLHEEIKALREQAKKR